MHARKSAVYGQYARDLTPHADVDTFMVAVCSVLLTVLNILRILPEQHHEIRKTGYDAGENKRGQRQPSIGMQEE